MTKKHFFELLKSAIKQPKGVTLISHTTNYDKSHNKIYYAVAIYYKDTMSNSIVISKKGDLDSIEAIQNLDKYKKYFSEFQNINTNEINN